MKRAHIFLVLLIGSLCFINVHSIDDDNDIDENDEDDDDNGNEIQEEVHNTDVNNAMSRENKCPPNYELKNNVCVSTTYRGGAPTFNVGNNGYNNLVNSPYINYGSPYNAGPVCPTGRSYSNGVCLSQPAIQSCSSQPQGCVQPSNGYSCGGNMVVYGGGCVSQSIATCPQGFILRNGICYRDAVEITKCPPGTTFENGACRKDVPCPENSFYYNGACLQCPPNTIRVDDMCLKCPDGMNMKDGQCHCPSGTIRENDRCVYPTPQISYPMPPNPVSPVVLPVQTVSYVAPIRETTQQMEIRQPIMVQQPQQQPIMQRMIVPQPQPVMVQQPQPIMVQQPQPIMVQQPQPIMVQQQPIMVQQQQPIMVQQPQPFMMQQPQPMLRPQMMIQQPMQSSCSVCS